MQDVTNVATFLGRAAEKTGYVRERFVDGNVPTVHDNVAVMMFYGDMRGEFILSSLLFDKIKELHPSKYIVLCSYPGRASLYPNVDEYWGLQDEVAVKDLLDSAIGLNNETLSLERNLHRYFPNFIDLSDYDKFYKDGFTKEYFDKFKWVTYSLPTIPSSKVEFNRALSQKPGFKVLIYPSRVHHVWSKGQELVVKSNIEFWHTLCNRLIDSGFLPVVYQDYGTYDLSRVMESRCVYVTEKKMIDVMGAMRTTGCVLDVYSGISWMSAMARTPFLTCVDRKLHNCVKWWEIDCLCNNNLPHRYIFGFPTIIERGFWVELADTISSKLSEFIPELNRDEWPSTSEQSVIVPYSLVQKRKTKKIGARFIKVQKF